MYFDNFIENAFDSINNRDNKNKLACKEIIHLKNEISPNKVENFVELVKKKEFDGMIGGVDSGFVSKRMSYIDLVLIRTCGVVFDYEKSILKSADYIPSPVNLPKPLLLKQGLEKDEELQSISLLRLKEEVGISIDILKNKKPKFLFIDGSIVPQYQDKPRSDSKINSDYNSIIDLFESMYKNADENKTTLISTIEDSRGVRFKQIISDYFKMKNKEVDLSNSTDSSILDYFLKKGERTFCFKYTKDISSHAILKDYDKKWSENIYVFYMKASDYDSPLRIEFICNNKNNLKEMADEISSVVYNISSLHKEYSYPSVLIEADLRARLNEEDISVVYDKLVDKLGPKLLLRRNSRPFK
jgi:hypothetical protein